MAYHWHWLCAVFKTVMFCRAYQTLSWRLRDSLYCKDCCRSTALPTYLLYYEWQGRSIIHLKLREDLCPSEVHVYGPPMHSHTESIHTAHQSRKLQCSILCTHGSKPPLRSPELQHEPLLFESLLAVGDKREENAMMRVVYAMRCSWQWLCTVDGQVQQRYAYAHHVARIAYLSN